jgi:hypothetical protein
MGERIQIRQIGRWIQREARISQAAVVQARSTEDLVGRKLIAAAGLNVRNEARPGAIELAELLAAAIRRFSATALPARLSAQHALDATCQAGEDGATGMAGESDPFGADRVLAGRERPRMSGERGARSSRAGRPYRGADHAEHEEDCRA